MARHSAAEQAAAEIALESPRLAPPAELSPEEAAHWRTIVASMPASWFDGANGPTLCELVHHIALSKQLAEQLATLRQTKLTAPTARGQRERDAFAQLLGLAREESKTIASLSTKLRLTNSSFRRDEQADARLKHAQPQGPRPWERQ
jgi:hypothetical protein